MTDRNEHFANSPSGSAEKVQPMSNSYEVEEILDKRIQDGVAWYLVKWQLFSELDNTWEPEHHFTDKRLLDEFNRQYEQIKKRPVVDEAKRTDMTPDAKRQQDSVEKKTQAIPSTSRLTNIIRPPSKITSITPNIFNTPIPSTANTPPPAREASPQRGSIADPFLKIQGLYVDPNLGYWFNIESQGQRRTVSREQAIRLNYLALIQFYERNIHFYHSKE